jgi:hypothetical protein
MGYTDRLIRNANLHYRLAHAKDVALRQFEVSLLEFYGGRSSNKSQIFK